MNPKRANQIERAIGIMDKSGILDFLKDNHQLIFLLKKTERIIAAIYLITTQFPDAEPLKWELRESGVVLIKDILSFKERASMHAREFVAPALSELLQLLSLLDLAHLADFVSAANFALLKKELIGLAGLLEGKTRDLGGSSAFLDEHFFGIPSDIFAETREEKGAAPAPVLRSKDEGAFTVIHSFSELEKLGRQQKEASREQAALRPDGIARGVSEADVPLPEGEERGKDEKPRKTQVFSRFILDKINEERRELILEVIKKKGSATINDLAGTIKNCSEKTIQRRLLEMVSKGVLVKAGKKRWSRYSVAL